MTNKLPKAMLLFTNYGPYHVARWRAAASYFAAKGVDLLPVQLAATQETYPWESQSATAQIPIITLVAGKSYHQISPFQAVSAICRFLRDADISWGAIPGYARWEFLAALFFLRSRGKAAVMMMDSKFDDFPRTCLKEWLKRLVVRRFNAALVAGKEAERYAASLGILTERIFPGYDVVDNRYFAEAASRIRAKAEDFRQQYALPEKYFLSVGRFVAKKNFALLLQAFAQYRAWVGKPGWHLVLCGAGPFEGALMTLTRELGVEAAVHFPGFRQVEDLPVFYSLASAFVLASSHSEQWGLVVNEAMASGLPVLVSQACGCAVDLVQEGLNGFTFDPADEISLAHLLKEFASGAWDLEEMGQMSQQIIRDWSLDQFAKSLWSAFTVTS